jgi:hypothetical protein
MDAVVELWVMVGVGVPGVREYATRVREYATPGWRMQPLRGKEGRMESLM